MFSNTQSLYPNAVRYQKDDSRLFATLVDADGNSTVISFADLDNASNRSAWFLQNEIPHDKTFFYMGPNDIRYLIWVLAAMKTEKCVVFASLANQVPANRRFFQSVGAHRLLYAPESSSALRPLLEATEDVVTSLATPDYQKILCRDAAREYPFDATFEDLRNVNFMGLHTSGTSGHPKPIYWTHAAATVLASALDSSFSSEDAPNLLRELWQSPRLFVSFPLSHLAGIGPVLGSIHCPNTIVLPAPGTPLSPPNLATILTVGSCTAAFAPPAILEAALTYPDPAPLVALSQLNKLAYTGGPLNPSRGRQLAEAVPHLFPVLASTEGGPGQFVSSSSRDHWDSFRFVDVGQRMDEVAPGLYELVFPRTETAEKGYAFFHTSYCFSSQTEYRTKDLLSPVEEEDVDGNMVRTGWWRYRGRADNWIAMSNGLKMDPTSMEATVSAHPEVSGVVVAGAHRFRLCMLIELRSPLRSDNGCAGDEETNGHSEVLCRTALERLWPTIDEANRKAPKFGRVPRELVIFASPETPFLRAAKGTIQRRLTVDAYASKIDEMYTKLEGGLLTPSGIPPLKSTEKDDLMIFLQNIYLDALQLNDEGDTTFDSDLELDDDLFSRGLDSLTTFIITARLRAGLRATGIMDEMKLEQVDHKLIYSASTINRMTEALSLLFSSAPNIHDQQIHLTKLEQENLDTQILLEKHEAQLDGILADNVTLNNKIQSLENGKSQKGAAGAETKEKEKGETILLTGSTGSLGTYILHSLLSSPRTNPPPKKVIILTRSSNPRQTQAASFLRRGLPDYTTTKTTQTTSTIALQFIRTHPTPQNPLGIDDHAATLISGEDITTIIHAAYPVNFLLGTRSFEMQIGAWVQLLGIASSAPSPVKVFFVSSIAAGMRVLPPPASAADAGEEGQLEEEEEEEEEIPEAVLPTGAKGAERLLPQGYARSKFICERLLERWAKSEGTVGTGTLLRVGQVCGPVGGGDSRDRGTIPGEEDVWNPAEWVPSLVISSKYLGVVPASLGRDGEEEEEEVAWVPVNQLGDIVADLVVVRDGDDDTGGTRRRRKGEGVKKNFVVHNVVNPYRASWGQVVVPAVVGSGGTTVVSAREWVGRLKESVPSSSSHVQENPASRLVDFYEQVMLGYRPPARVRVDSLLRASETARNKMYQIVEGDMRRWMKGWGL